MSIINEDCNYGVYELLTVLCEKTSANFCDQNKISQKVTTAKMRSRAYEIILKKSTAFTDMSSSEADPFINILSYYFVCQSNARNVTEFKRMVELKNLISIMRKTDYGQNKELIYNVLKLLNVLRGSLKQDFSGEIFKKPFSFGLLNQMLPKPKRESFGSPDPYPYYPSHIFELPYSLKRQGGSLDYQSSQCYTEYTVSSFDSKSMFQDSQNNGGVELKKFISPMSLASMTTSSSLPVLDNNIFNYPRLTAPRDLQIPTSHAADPNVKVSLPSTNTDVREVFRAQSNEFVDIWEIATQIDKDIPDDLWDIVSSCLSLSYFGLERKPVNLYKCHYNPATQVALTSLRYLGTGCLYGSGEPSACSVSYDIKNTPKLPPIQERQIIASSPREMALWRNVYESQLSDLDIISENLFIRHIKYLIIGVETTSFPYSPEFNCFYMKDNLILEGISKECLKGYVSSLLMVGTYYKRLYIFAFNTSFEDNFRSKGLIYEAAREVIRRYLLDFRLEATTIYEDCCKNMTEDMNCMPTLLQILYHMEPLKYEIETIVSIYKLTVADSVSTIPHGAELMSYLFKEISLVTHKKTALILYNSLISICKVYFKFIERFIFEGELHDPYNEFFIRKDNQYVNSRSKRYWDKGFHIAMSVAVPEFLRPLAPYILLCGKSFRLLKQCNPSDPLVLLLSSAHPSVRCCWRWQQLERARRLLAVFRTRCLFVAGERASLQRILLQRDAERKAFTEMASLKQAETLEKIIAERKRLAQLIVAEKQHSLKILEAAMAEAKAAKNKMKQRERRLHQLEAAAEKATEEVDSKLKETESNKIMEYYSKLNMEVEKSKLHTEWKIKRLQLDESRMQLLSTEERNLKREKLELEHQRNEAVMAMSIQSVDLKSDEELESKCDDETIQEEETVTQIIKPDIEDAEINKNVEKHKIKSTSDMFSAICNVAKTIFGVKNNKEEEKCDNEMEVDIQGNIITSDADNNVSYNKYKTSSQEIGINVDNTGSHLKYLEIKQDALKNKQKVMTHEFGRKDFENNQLKNYNEDSTMDEENNIAEWSPFAEAMRNRLKILGAEFDVVEGKVKTVISTEPRTEAQKAALINKQKVLGVEYNLPPEMKIQKEPMNIAQEEALRNKTFRDTEFHVVEGKIKTVISTEPRTEAQKEALINKQKILGVEYNLPLEMKIQREPMNIAQEEALRNKTFRDTEFHVVEGNIKTVISTEPKTEAQKEALINKQKILGVEYNLPLEMKIQKEPMNIAQEEALRNKTKVLGSDSEVGIDVRSVRFDTNKKNNLRLNLKPYNETLAMKNITDTSIGVVTPGELIPSSVQLDLETPTTADIPMENATTSDVFTPRSECNKDIELVKLKDEKEFLTSDGFNFSLIVDETASSELGSNVQIESPENSPSKSVDFGVELSPCKSIFNILDGTHSLDSFDPFGLKQWQGFSKDYFHTRINADMSGSFYTHPATIMDEVKKSPSSNVFASRFDLQTDADEKLTCDNIATLTACLQRSVMLPLTYQMEVVNNSIINYFLINLDMYEHLRSLKDYFFLMDGEFSRSICHNLFSKLTKTLNPQELLNFATLHNILDKALGSSIMHIHKFSENLSFSITESPLCFQHSSPDVLQCLSLTYSVSWPLNIILSPEALTRYSKVFQFLIKMRRISWVLSEDFQSLKLSVKLLRQQSRKLLRSPQYISVQIYRHIMASLIRALDNYIVTTCILSSWTEFETDLKKARTLNDLSECHVVYVKKVVYKCLLNNRSTPVMKLLNDMFTVILKFSRILKAGVWQQKEPNGHYTHSSFNQLEELFNVFKKLTKYLHKVVTTFTEVGYQRHLLELLTMINLNGYYNYERSKEDTHTSVQST